MAVTPTQVLTAGANGLTQLASSPTVLEGLRRAYGQATRNVFFLGLAFASLALLPSCAMEWLNIAQESKKRKESQVAEDIEPNGDKETTDVDVATGMYLEERPVHESEEREERGMSGMGQV